MHAMTKDGLVHDSLMLQHVKANTAKADYHGNMNHMVMPVRW